MNQLKGISYANKDNIVSFIENNVVAQFKNRTVVIITIDNSLVLHENDWLVRTLDNKLTCCNPIIFNKTYEPID